MTSLFMIGTQRSGFNLLRLMLNQLNIAVPHPPHILQRLMPELSGYGDMRRPAVFQQLVDDVCCLIERNPVPWEGVQFDRGDVISRCLPMYDPIRSAETLSMPQLALVAIQGAVYDIYAESQGARIWCCKSLANIKYVHYIERYFHDPRYIYLYRDGRDVAVSLRKSVVGEKHFYHIAREWAAAQELALGLRAEIDPKRFIGISYEELTGSPEKTAAKLCEFIGVPCQAVTLNCAETTEAERAAKAGELWSNVARPALKSNTRTFMRHAREEDIRVFESIAGHVLDALGYSRAYVQSGREDKFTPEDIETFDRENQRLKDVVLNGVDPVDLGRRDRQAALLKEIRARNRDMEKTCVRETVAR